MKETELKTICSFVRHCERMLFKYPPPSTDNVTYNSYRIARYKELPRVKRILNNISDTSLNLDS